YALEQLEASGASDDRSRRHALYFLGLAEHAEPHLRGPDQRSWFDRLDRELDNLRLALAWAAASNELEVGLRLALALGVFCEERGHVREMYEWLETLTSQLAARRADERLAPLQAYALASSAWLAFLQGDYQSAVPRAEQSILRWRELGQV